MWSHFTSEIFPANRPFQAENYELDIWSLVFDLYICTFRFPNLFENFVFCPTSHLQTPGPLSEFSPSSLGKRKSHEAESPISVWCHNPKVKSSISMTALLSSWHQSIPNIRLTSFQSQFFIFASFKSLKPSTIVNIFYHALYSAMNHLNHNRQPSVQCNRL